MKVFSKQKYIECEKEHGFPQPYIYSWVQECDGQEVIDGFCCVHGKCYSICNNWCIEKKPLLTKYEEIDE